VSTGGKHNESRAQRGDLLDHPHQER
jgi:hypothetical protein